MTRRLKSSPLLITCLAIFVLALLTLSSAAQIERNKQTAGGIRAGESSTASPREKQPEVFSSAAVGVLASSSADDPADGQPVIFAPVVAYSTGVYPNSIAVGDVNGDGYPDVVTPGSLLLGNGDGTFQSLVLISGTEMNGSVALGDVNGDGRLDVMVTVFSGEVIVLIGNGDGTFQAPVSYGSGGLYPYCVVVEDVNGDGKPDLLVANDASGLGGFGTVGVLLGNGDGTFQTAVTYPIIGPTRLAIGDLNGDSHPDLAVSSSTGWATILLNNGDGTFRQSNYFNAASWLASLDMADVNGDGKQDLVLPDMSTNTVAVLLGNGDGTFQPPLTYSSGGLQPWSLAIGDVNGDGHPDIAVANQASNTVGLLFGDGDGTFQTPVDYPSGGYVARALAIADVNGDTRPDLLAVNICSNSCYSAGTVGVLLNNGGAPTSTTTVTSSLNPANVGQSVTYTATVTPQAAGMLSGTITFFEGESAIATVPLANNQATYTTSYVFPHMGLHSIKATFWGKYRVIQGSQSATLSQYVRNRLSQTVLSTSGSPTFIGQPVTFTAIATSKNLPVPDGEQITFYDGPVLIGTRMTKGGVATLTISTLVAKTHTMKAVYTGDNQIEPSHGTVTQVVEKYPTGTTLKTSTNPSIYGQKVSFATVVTTAGLLSPTGKVLFKYSGHTLGSATLDSNGVATLTKTNLNAGSFPLTAVYEGDANNAASTSPVMNQTVLQTTSAATVSSSINPSSVGQAVMFTAKITSPTVTPTGAVTFSLGQTTLGTVPLSGGKATFTALSLPAGSNTVRVTYQGNSNVAKSSAVVTQVVD